MKILFLHGFFASGQCIPAMAHLVCAADRKIIMESERLIIRPWPPHKSVEESKEIIRTVFNNDHTV